MIAGLIEAVNPALPQAVRIRRAALVTAQIEGNHRVDTAKESVPSDIKGIEDDAVTAILALAKAP